MFRSKTTIQQHTKKHPSSFPNTSIRPPFLSTTRPNSSSSSSTHSQSSGSQPTTYKPLLYQNQSSFQPNSSESIFPQTSSSQPASFGPIVHQSSSSSHLDHEQDQLDENEMKLLTEVKITDEQGSILRLQKMTTKDVYKLKDGEQILVHVNEFGQPIKAAGGICTRFMTSLLKQPNLCPPAARDWREVKMSCGVRILGELRRKFNLPQSESVEKVLFAIFDDKHTTLKHKFKRKLFRLATVKLNEVNNIVDVGAQEVHYTEEELLQALDLIEVPSRFLDHQWELYKSHLRAPIAKKLKNKRDPNDVEFFDIAYQTKKGTYVGDSSRHLMDRAREEVSKRILDIGNSENNDPETRSEIERDVMMELMGPDKPRRARGYGTGVTKSQVTKFSFDLRRTRSAFLTNQNRVLLNKVESQSKQIESQNKQIRTMEQKIDGFSGELQVFKMAFKDLYNTRASKDAFFTAPHIARDEMRNKQVERANIFCTLVLCDVSKSHSRRYYWSILATYMIDL